MIADVPGVAVGHWTDGVGLTGYTVVVCPPGTVGSVFVAGAAPGTRETDLLAPGNLVEAVDAIVLSGGSAFGLAAADGVVRRLAEIDRGFPTPGGSVPIVPAAVVFDLTLGDASARPGEPEGYEACARASTDDRAQGNVGAGTGATVGKLGGDEHRSKGGLGQASARSGHLVAGALAVVNAVGDVVEDDGRVIAGARGSGGSPALGTATTLLCVATNADLDKAACHRVARAVAGNLARAIRPVHTMFDGDVVFVLATREQPAAAPDVERLAVEVAVESVRNGVRAAESVDGAPAHGRPPDDLSPKETDA